MRPLSHVALISLVLAGCGSAEPSPPPPVPSPREPPAPIAEPATGSPAGDARCLPIVAAECGCVYRCAEGALVEGGTYRVTDPFWTEPLTARVDRWCVGGECTDAFFAEILCGLICAPRPADPTCAFREGRCQSGRPEARIEGAFTVDLDGDGSPDGSLGLADDGRFHYSGAGPPTPLADRFHFARHPEGRFRFDPSSEPTSTTLGVLRLDPDDDGFIATDPTRSFEVRQTRDGLELHGIVSELQTWRIERHP